MKKILMVAILICLLPILLLEKLLAGTFELPNDLYSSVKMATENDAIGAISKNGATGAAFTLQAEGEETEEYHDDFLSVLTEIFNESAKYDINLRLVKYNNYKILITATSLSNKNIKNYLDSLVKLRNRDVILLNTTLNSKKNIEFTCSFKKKPDEKGIKNRKIASKIEAPSLLRRLYTSGKEFDLNFEQFAPMNSVKIDLFEKIPVDIVSKGTFQIF